MPETNVLQRDSGPGTPRGRRGAGEVMIVFNGVVAGAAGAYLTTGSATVALIAALLAVALAAWLVLLDR